MEREPREQILSTAMRLFYEQGYERTGINQLIDESQVARRTFYHHFPSKEALGAEYLDAGAAQWLAGLRGALAGRRGAVAAVRALFDHVERFALGTRFRGCGMLNMAAEFADASGELRARVQRHKQAQRDLLRELLGPLGVARPLADQVNVLLEGAIAGASGLLDVAPIHAASQAAQRLVTPRRTKR